MPANGSLCPGWTCLQTRRSAKESGHSLEFNGPLQTREHSLLVIRRKERALGRLCSRQGFHSPCCTITCMHLRCTEKAYSCSLEFCLGGFIKINRNWFCAVFSSGRSGILSVSCVSRVFCLRVISLTTSGAQRGARVKPKAWVTLGGFYIHSRGTLGKIMGNSSSSLQTQYMELVKGPLHSIGVKVSTHQLSELFHLVEQYCHGFNIKLSYS